MQFLDRMKQKWGVGLWGVIAILLIFSLAGTTVVRLKDPVLGLLLPDDAPTWVSWVAYVVVIFPIYQVCLLTYAAVLGQFGFFWGKTLWTWRFLFGWLRPRSKKYQTASASIDRDVSG